MKTLEFLSCSLAACLYDIEKGMGGIVKAGLIALVAVMVSFRADASFEVSEYLVKTQPQAATSELRAIFGPYTRVAANVILVRMDRSRLNQAAHLRPDLYIEPNHKLKTLNVPNDLTSSLWNLRSSRGFDINAVKAWELTTGSRDVVVAVIDTGIDLRHPDLMDNLWVNEAERSGQAGVDDDSNGFIDDIHGYDFAMNNGNPQDEKGHGTHVAGTIGATGNNGRGVVGMNWSVSMMALKMFPRYSDAKVSDAIRAIDYAIANGARIINASWGQSGDDQDPTEFKLLSEAVERARDAGVLFVAAAGNNRSDNDSKSMIPATLKIENIISVGSMTERGQRSSFSNFGASSVHVFAPGQDIISTVVGGSTDRKSGTSMAAPHIAGLAALMLARRPQMSVEEIKTAIVGSCSASAQLSSFTICGGHVDAAKALAP